MVEVLGEDSLLRAAWLAPRGSGCGMLVEISAAGALGAHRTILRKDEEYINMVDEKNRG